MVKSVYIKGNRGDWLADVEGERLAVLHSTWRVGLTEYCDPMTDVDTSGKRYLDLVGALNTHDIAVIQKDKSKDDLSRDGYVGVFRFKNLVVGEDGSLRLEFTERVANPKA